MGLAALMLLQHARAPARFDADGALVLLEDQDRSLWRGEMIDEGLALVDKALRHGKPGPYQVQAAIAALHARARRPEETDWREIDLLYALLERLQPSPGGDAEPAVAWPSCRAGSGAGHGRAAGRTAVGLFHFHGLRGGLLMQMGRAGEARVAFDRAIALANTAAEAAHIRQHIDRLMREGAAGDPVPTAG